MIRIYKKKFFFENTFFFLLFIFILVLQLIINSIIELIMAKSFEMIERVGISTECSCEAIISRFRC